MFAVHMHLSKDFVQSFGLLGSGCICMAMVFASLRHQTVSRDTRQLNRCLIMCCWNGEKLVSVALSRFTCLPETLGASALFAMSATQERPTQEPTLERPSIYNGCDTDPYAVDRSCWQEEEEQTKSRTKELHLTVVVIGASGDLAKKKTFPALAAIFGGKDENGNGYAARALWLQGQCTSNSALRSAPSNVLSPVQRCTAWRKYDVAL